MNKSAIKRFAATVLLLAATATVLAAVTLQEVRFQNGDFNQKLLSYVEEGIDLDYSRSEFFDHGDTVYYHHFGSNADIVTGTVENGLSKSIHLKFEPEWYYEDTRYFNVFTGFYDDSRIDNDNSFHWFECYDESDPTRLYCEDYDWDTEEDIFYTASAEYDKSHRLTHLVIDDVAEVWVTYHTGGKIASYKDTSGYSFTFSPEGKLTELTYPNGRHETITWNKRGLEESRTCADGTSWTNTYDKKNRLVTRTYKDGAVITYEYDAKGRLSHQFTQVKDVNQIFDEITYTWNSTGLICLEEQSNGNRYLIQYDEYEPTKRHYRYRIVDPVEIEGQTVTELPVDYGMFGTSWEVANHGIFADGDQIYLFPYTAEAPGYVYNAQGLTATKLPVITSAAGNTNAKDNARYGDFILAGNHIYYKDFSTVINLHSDQPDWLHEELLENYQYYSAMHDGVYILPKGILFVDEYDRNGNMFALEFDGSEPVKLIHGEQVPEWVASQEGYSMELEHSYNGYYHDLYKDGFMYSHYSPLYGEKYHNDVDDYVGTIQGQFNIWEIYRGCYAICDRKGNLLTYFLVQQQENTNYAFDFSENGELYAVTTPSYTTKVHYFEDDYVNEFLYEEGSTGKLVAFTGYLDSFCSPKTDKVAMKKYPKAKSATLGTYGKDTVFFILDTVTVAGKKKGSEETWYKVQLGDGTTGFVQAEKVTK